MAPFQVGPRGDVLWCKLPTKDQAKLKGRPWWLFIHTQINNNITKIIKTTFVSSLNS